MIRLAIHTSARIVALALFCCFTCITAFGQADDSTAVKNRNFLQRSGTDIKHMGLLVLETYKRPFHWKKKEWLQFGVVLGGAALATTLDEPVYDFFQDHQNGFMDGLSEAGFLMGKPGFNYPIMISVWGVGEIIQNEWMRETGVMMISSVTASGILQTISKSLFGRARPSTGEGPYSFDPFSEYYGYHSLPSGHSTLSFALNWVLAKQTNWLPAKILFYTIPVVVSVSRLYNGAHWFSDVLLGAALGIAGAETALHFYPKLKAKEQGLTMGFTPSGMGMVYKF